MLIRKRRVRFQSRKKKGKQDDGGKAQGEPVRTTHVGNPETTLFEGVVEEPRFVRKRVPSVDELGKHLRSNLSTSLAAAKAPTIKHNATCSPSTSSPTGGAQPQESDEDPPASFLELAPMYRPVGDHLEAIGSCAILDDEGSGDNGPSASLLATTAIYRPVGDYLEPAGPGVVADEHADEGNKPPSSLLATTEVLIPVEDHSEAATQTSATAVPAAEPCAIEEYDGPHASLLIESRESFINYIRPPPRSATLPLQPSKSHPTFLQRVVRLFAGRLQYPVVSEDKSGNVSNQSEVQSQSSTTAISPPSAVPPRGTASGPKPPPPKPIPRRKLPLSPPILATHRPYRPREENLSEPFIAPAKEHKYTGDYSVAPDVYNPAEVHQGFASPTSPVSPTLADRRQNSAATLLDRDKTAWGKWYAKTSKSQSLHFARVKSTRQLSGLDEELTEQQAWDAYRTDLVRAQTDSNEHASDMDESRDAEAAEEERAARLRDHLGHCFGAVTGDVYPFQSGRII